MAKPVAELVRHLFLYDPETGAFYWKNNPAGVKWGSRAGCVDTDRNGYKRRRIRIAGKMYRSSDIAWLYMTGEWPPASVDHEDRDGVNDCWNNLRLATRSQQMTNRRGWGATKSRGVTYNSKHDRYYARIQVGRQPKFLGSFKTEDEAQHAYVEAAKLLHGDFMGDVQ